MTYDNEFLKQNKACERGYDWAQTQTYRGHSEFLREAAKKDFGYFTWCLEKSFTKTQSVEFAIYCAELVLPILEKKYPDDKRPRNTIDAAKAYHANPTEENRIAARAAAYAADYAADAAADTAHAAAYAALAAAYAALADDSADAETKQKLAEKAIEILNRS